MRILTQKYIDCRISNLQKQKSEIIDRALQDDGHVPTVLSDMQLRYLFDPEGARKGDGDLKSQIREAQELELALQDVEELDDEGEE